MGEQIFSALAVYYDQEDSFNQINKFDPYKDPQCFLVCGNTVIFEGDTILNKKIMTKFLAIIKKYNFNEF